MRCPSIVQARIRLKSKSSHFNSSSRSSSTYPFDAKIYEKPLFMSPQFDNHSNNSHNHHNHRHHNTTTNTTANNTSTNNYLSQSQNQTTNTNFTTNNSYRRPPPTHKPVYPSLLRNRSQYLDQTDSNTSYNQQRNTTSNQQPPVQKQPQQQQTSNGINLPIDLPPHYQNPQVSTNKIYVQNMTPQPTTHLQDEITTKSGDDYSYMDGNKSYTTFSTSPFTKSERERNRFSGGYHSEFTVKGMNHFLGYLN